MTDSSDDMGIFEPAIVVRVEEYGLYVDVSGRDALVLITEVRERGPTNLPVLYRVGDRVMVKTLDYIPERKLFKATMLGRGR